MSDRGERPDYNPDRLTLFVFLWACQALVHQEFYSRWLAEDNLYGWLLTGVAMATLLNPRSLLLFTGMLIASVVYNVLKWPFVVNHILVETLINLTILASIGGILIRRRGDLQDPLRRREAIYEGFAPVVRWMLIVMYYFALIAKLNHDFFDTDLSCVAMMYHDLVRRAPFLPTALWAKTAAIWGTVVIEAAIPLLLTFRRTRYLGVGLGMPFHLMLGLIGHRTFSALAFALYALFLMRPLIEFINDLRRWLIAHLGKRRLAAGLTVGRIAAVALVATLIGADMSGHYRSGIGPFLIYRVAWVVWILWSLIVATLYVTAICRRFGRAESASPALVGGPLLLWAALLPVLLNGLSQYMGLKTETCFTMYSNLRTEGGINNHLFMPALRLAGYQDDLVEILRTDHPRLLPFVESEQLLTRFEFRRILSDDDRDCSVLFHYEGKFNDFHRHNGKNNHPDLAAKHPFWLAKLLYFRPVPKGTRCPCQH